MESKNKTILVVGGAGFIGSYVNKMLYKAGYQTIVFDNLSRGHRSAACYGTFVQGDMANRDDLYNLFRYHKIDAVMHFAAYTDVGESVRNPLLYYQNNVANTLNLLEVMIERKVKFFIFSSTAAIFGIPQQKKITEEHHKNPINPYGESKLMVEKILIDCDYAYGLKSCCLRYFNAAGGDPSGEICAEKVRETNLIPIVLRSIKEKSPVTIFGTDYDTIDGTCIRDYIHVHDLGEAHLAALKNLFEGADSDVLNLGNGNGFSVKEVIQAAQKVTGSKINVIEGPRRPGDPPVLLADATKAHNILGWKPIYPDLESMVTHAWKVRH